MPPITLPPVNIPDTAAAFLPLIAASLSRYLRSDGLPAWKNALIALAAIVAAALGIYLVTNGFAGAPAQAPIIILAIAIYLLHHDFQFLFSYLYDLASPLLKSVSAVSSNVQPIQIPAPAQPVVVTPNPQPAQAPSPEQSGTATTTVPPAPAQ